MFIPHVFVHQALEAGMQAPLAAEEAHHLVRVLRLRAGDRVVAVAPGGQRWLGRLVQADPSAWAVEAERLLPTSEPPLRVTLGQGLPKGQKMDEVIRHGTEVGVTTFVPIWARRSVPRPGGTADGRRERWQRVAREAARQAQRSLVPEVKPPTTLPELLAHSTWDLILMPWEEESAHGLHPLLQELAGRWGRPARGRSVLVLIGPEGGWDPGEVDAARSRGARVVTLGPRILRTETAGVIVTALLLHALGDLG